MTKKKMLSTACIILTYVGVAMIACGLTGKVVFGI